jgi:hypothetical protein
MYRNFADPYIYPHTQEWSLSAFDGCTTCGMARRTQSLTELRPSVLPRLVCWAVWPTSGIDGRLDRRREKMLVAKHSNRRQRPECLEKFLRYLDVEPRIVPLKAGNYRLTAEYIGKYVGRKHDRRGSHCRPDIHGRRR